jgi:hypothetical protein
MKESEEIDLYSWLVWSEAFVSVERSADMIL